MTTNEKAIFVAIKYFSAPTAFADTAPDYYGKDLADEVFRVPAKFFPTFDSFIEALRKVPDSDLVAPVTKYLGADYLDEVSDLKHGFIEPPAL